MALGRPIHLPPPRQRAKAAAATVSSVRASTLPDPDAQGRPGRRGGRQPPAAGPRRVRPPGRLRPLHLPAARAGGCCRRCEAIIREEMDTIGLEMLHAGAQSGRAVEDAPTATTSRQLFKLEDSSGKPYVLAMTHEECVTFHAAREIRSYRDLPQIWYHIQTKERDEPRPKSGILRTREFIMKDSYSFDRDVEGLDESYRRAHRRSTSGSTTAAGCEYLDGRVRRRHDGRHRGARVHGAQPGRRGRPSRCARAATTPRTSRWRGRRSAAAASSRRALDAPEEIETPGVDDDRGPGRDARASTRPPPPRRWSSSRTATVVLGARPRRPPPARDEAGEGAGGAVRPATPRGDRARRSAPSRARSAPVGADRAGDRRRGAARRAVRRRRQPHRLAPAGRRGRPRLPGRSSRTSARS